MSKTEEFLLMEGSVIGQLAYKDIYFFNPGNRGNDLHEYKLKFFVEGQSWASPLDDIEYDEYRERIKMFEDNKIFYWAILLENKKGKNPFERAIEKNSPKLVEMQLDALNLIGGYNISKIIYKYFPELFDMGLKGFETFLDTCYF